MKKRPYLYWPTVLLAFLWLVALTTCTLTSKEPERKPAAGRVLEYGTLKPIAGAVVTLYECEGEVLGNFSCHAIDSTASSNDGQYAFSQTGFLTNARKAGYFTDDFTEAHVLFGSEDKADIILPPYAWLKVNIRNESGAYGFFPPRNGSGYPPIQLEQGQDSTLGIELRKGNDFTKYIFTVNIEEGGAFPDQNYWQNVKAAANGTPIDVKIGVGAILDLYLVGHDTTTLIITY